MKIPSIKRLGWQKNGWVYSLIVLLLLVVYGLTMARDYTWEHWGSDAGDLIASVYTLGIPHPPGTPLYVLVLQPFRLIPVGPPAFKTNLASAFFAILAVLILVKTVLKLTRNNWPAALTAGLYLAFAPTFWSQALITEVLTLHAFLTGLVVYFIIRWLEDHGSRWWYLALFTLGLALANHTTSLMLLPAIGYLFLARVKISRSGLRGSLVSVFFLALGLLPYLYIPIRSRAEPPLNWGRPDNLTRFLVHFTGQQYHQMLFYNNPLQVIDAGIKFLASIANNLTYAGLLLATAGLVLSHQKRELKIFTAFVFLFQALFVSEYKIPNIETFNLTAFWVAALWIGLGVGVISRMVTSMYPSARKKISILFLSVEKPAWLGGGRFDYPLADLLLSLPLLVFFLVPFFQLERHWSKIDVSRAREGADYGKQVFENLLPGALVFTEGDKFSLALDYQRWVVHPERRDVAVMVNGLYLRDWRLENYRRLYPDVVFPDRPVTTDEKTAFEALLEMIELNINRRPIYLTLDYPPPKPNLTTRLEINDWVIQSEGPIYRVLGKVDRVN